MNKTLLKYIDQVDFISFDIFDTALLRTYLKPSDLFFDLQLNLNKLDNPVRFKDFANIRIQAEYEIRKASNFRNEITLSEIYDKIKTVLLLMDNEKDTILKKELSLEEKALTYNPEIKEFIQLCRNLDKKIIYISDIYLPEDFIATILKKFNLLYEDDKLFLSSSIGKMKASGEIYPYILDKLVIEAKEILHIGDNKNSDYDMARKHALLSYHYSNSSLNRYEIFGKEINSNHSIIISRVAAISKINRLSAPSLAGSQRVIWDTTSNVSAPLLYFFVQWIMSKAIELKIERLYFLSRDGQILYKIAEKILEKYNYNIEIQYLFVSRQSLLFSAISEINQEALQWIMAPTQILTPRIILRRINFNPDELGDSLNKFGFLQNIDEQIPENRKGNFINFLKSNSELILSRAGEYRKNAIGYLKQEGLSGSSNIGLVDIGWSGTLQRSISRLLEREGYNNAIYGFYFGLKRRLKNKDNDQLFSWFTDYENPRKLDKDTYIIPMTELFTQADHGGVHSYFFDKDSKKCEVKLIKEKNESGMNWGIDIQQKAVLNYTDLILNSSIGLENVETPLNFLESNYRKFLLNPDIMEAKAYGSFPLAEDQNESYYHPLAKKYSLPRLLKTILLGKSIKHNHNEWQEGAFRISSKLLLSIYNLMKRK